MTNCPCDQSETCQDLVSRGGHTLCEAEVPRSSRRRPKVDYRRHIIGPFTARQLAKMAGVSVNTAHAWALSRVVAGELAVVGQAEGPGQVNIYYYRRE